MPAEILEQVLGLLASAEPQSRNRQYEDFKSPQGRRVLKLFRIYQSLISELEEAAARPEVKVSAQADARGLMLTLEDPKVSYRRICVVPPELAALFQTKLIDLGLIRDQEKNQ